MEILLAIVIALYFATICTVCVVYKLNILKQQYEKKNKALEKAIEKAEKKEKSLTRLEAPHTDYATLIGIVDDSIEREFKVAYLLDLNLVEKVIIVDFEKDLRLLVEGVMSSFAMPFMEEIGYYHDKKYIITYITRILKIKLMRLIRERKVGIR